MSRLKKVKKGEDGEVPEEVQRECSLLTLGSNRHKKGKPGTWWDEVFFVDRICMARDFQWFPQSLGDVWSMLECSTYVLAFNGWYVADQQKHMFHRFTHIVTGCVSPNWPCHLRLRKDIDHPFIMTQVNTFETKKSVPWHTKNTWRNGWPARNSCRNCGRRVTGRSQRAPFGHLFGRNNGCLDHNSVTSC